MSRHERAASPSERTPEELAELRAERTRFSRERPGPEELMASGEYEGPYRQGNIMALLTGIAELKPTGGARLESRRRLGAVWTGPRHAVPIGERQDPEPDDGNALALCRRDRSAGFPGRGTAANRDSFLRVGDPPPARLGSGSRVSRTGRSVFFRDFRGQSLRSPMDRRAAVPAPVIRIVVHGNRGKTRKGR